MSRECRRCGRPTRQRLCPDCHLEDRYGTGRDAEPADADGVPYECARCGHRQVSTLEAGCEACGGARLRHAGDQLATDGGHPPDELVWVRSSSAGCRRNIYHTDPDCHMLARATSKSQKRIGVLADDVTACKVCTGEAEQAGGMPPKSESLFARLEAADPDDLGDGALLPDGGEPVDEAVELRVRTSRANLAGIIGAFGVGVHKSVAYGRGKRILEHTLQGMEDAYPMGDRLADLERYRGTAATPDPAVEVAVVSVDEGRDGEAVEIPVSGIDGGDGDGGE